MYVHVQASAGAKRESLECTRKDFFKISVREPPRQNLANRRVAALLAAHFGVPPRTVRLVAGHRTPKKIFDIDEDELAV